MKQIKKLKILYVILAVFLSCHFLSFTASDSNPLEFEQNAVEHNISVPVGAHMEIKGEEGQLSETISDESTKGSLGNSLNNLFLLSVVTVLAAVSLFGTVIVDSYTGDYTESFILKYIHNQDGKK
ncbi:MAG: hypothetical protein K6E79_07840 [Pseudobutyrivibrio sp.]|nr:hypothetical protein [Pseudobutyrivibrio sp.]